MSTISLFRNGMCMFAALTLLSGENNVIILSPNAKFSKIKVNGKIWPNDDEDFLRPRYTINFDFKGAHYFALFSGAPYDDCAQSEDVIIVDYSSLKIVGGFSTVCYYLGNNGNKSGANNKPWDGRSWTPDFDRCVLIEDWSKKELPMTLDSPSGFFPDQKLDSSIPVNRHANVIKNKRHNTKIK